MFKINTDIKFLMEKNGYNLKYMADYLKMSEFALNKIFNNDFTGFPKPILNDICGRLSSLFNEEIKIIDEDIIEIKNSDKKNPVNILKVIFNSSLIIIACLYIIYSYFLFRDFLTYNYVYSEKAYKVKITNESSEPVLFVNTGEKIDAGKTLETTINLDNKITIKNNKGIVKLETPFKTYKINIENFEVILKNGKSEKS